MRLRNNRAKWHHWFAWRPVRLGEEWQSRMDGDLVWLVWVERRTYHIGSFRYNVYREIANG